MLHRINQQIGNYRIVRFLGQGGYAVVYLGEHIYLKMPAAIKFLHIQMLEKDAQEFLREAQTIARFRHPHIIRVLEFGIDAQNAQPFLVMEYAPKGSLLDLHPHGTRLPLTTVVPYVKQMASALQYRHEQRIVHRDVKPGNMLVDATGAVVLSDFGIAVVVQGTQSMQSQNPVGTALYMAPEQIHGKARPASDQYSLAVVAYEWPCGVWPFERSTSVAIMMAHLNDPVVPLREHNPLIPAIVERVVLKALSKDPKARFATVNEFALALEQAYQLPKQGGIRRTYFVPPAYKESVAETLQSASPVAQPGVLTTVPAKQQAMSSDKSITLPTMQQDYTILQQEPSKPVKRFTRRALVVGMAVVAVGGVGSAFLLKNLTSPATVAYRTVAVNKNSTVTEVNKTLFVYRGHTLAIKSISWSSDGKYIVSAGNDRTVQIWDSKSGNLISFYKGYLPFSGQYGNEVRAVWSPDGSKIATAGTDKKVLVWQFKLKETFKENPVATFGLHPAGALSVSWSPDGNKIASGGYDANDPLVRIWYANTGSLIATCRAHSAAITSVIWLSLSENKIVSASIDRSAKVWNAVTGDLSYTYADHTDTIWSLACSPNGK